MNGIQFIRNRWVMLVCALMSFGILWGSFQWIYRDQILLRRLYNSGTIKDQGVALVLYRKLMELPSDQRDPQLLSLLAEILVKTGRWEEAMRIWERVLSQRPEDKGVRFRLALALHNQGKYLEAEKHFVVLLKGVNTDE